MLTQEEYVHRVLELKRQGWSIKEIAVEVGYHPSAAPGGPTKAAAVLEAAQKLVGIEVQEPADIADATVDRVKRAMRSVGGVGYATTNYFLMLLGRPGVKPGRMVLRFLAATLG